MSAKYIDRWLILLIAMLLMACSNEDDIPAEECYLEVYVYAPGRPIVTRGDVGETPSEEAERKVNTLQIWVFKHVNGSLVSYKDTTATYLNEAAGQEKFMMRLDRTFAGSPENVDVYVVANAKSCGLSSLDESTTRAQLDDAKISGNNFGTEELTQSVPADGLPMSAVLRNQPVTGHFPTLRIGTASQMATMELTRAVSKLRFVVCRVKEEDTADKKLERIDDISIDAGQIPEASYIIPRDNYSSYTYSHKPVIYGGVGKNDIPQVENPLIYVYETQKAQEYEDLINAAVNAGKLKQIGLTYFRESPKQISGTIKYTHTKGGTHQETVDFSISTPGDFLRNHTWIVYIYFMDSTVHVLTITDIGVKDWVIDPEEEDVTFHNW